MFATLFATTTLLAANQSVAADGWFSRMFSFERDKEVKAVSLKSYQDECSSCHYAYPPGLLPESSWSKLLAKPALAKHFGENIEMKETLRVELLAYAVAGGMLAAVYTDVVQGALMLACAVAVFAGADALRVHAPAAAVRAARVARALREARA